MTEVKKSKLSMSKTPVGKLMLSLGIPMILSMMLQALYNIVDSAFVSNMEGGEQALNALTLAFPIQMLMVAVAIGTGVGANALLAKTLGQNNEEKAAKVAGNAIFLGIVICIFFMLFGMFGVKVYIKTQTQNAVIFDMAVTYLRICCIGCVGIALFSIYEKLLQATGLSLYSTIAQVSGAVVNIILDPIMIYGWLGLPKLGVAGAAYATVIGQIVSFVLAFAFHMTKNKKISKHVKYIRPDLSIIKEIYAIGVPAIIAQALMSFMTYAINIILGRVDESLVTAYGLYYKVQQFILFAAFGLRDAITPVVAFAHGMMDKKRITDGIKYGVGYTLVIMLAGTLILEVFAAPLTGIFGLSGTTESLCISAMHVISISFVFAGVNVALQGVFQALDAGIESLIISVCRQCLFVLPVAFGLSLLVSPALDNAWIVWLTFPIAEAVSALIAVLLMARIHRKKIRNM